MVGSMADDTLEGTRAIAEFIGKTDRQTDHLLQSRQLPAFKLGGRWHMRKSTYLNHVERLEAEAAPDTRRYTDRQTQVAA
jgi:hypothetical protein